MWYDDTVKRAGDEFIKDVSTISEIRRLVSQQPEHHPSRTRVYDGKISLVCRERLLDCFRENITGEENAYVMPQILAHSYMSRLASIITQNDGTMPLTNDGFGNSILQSRYLTYSQEREQNQAVLVNLSLKTIYISPNVPLTDIIRFRENHNKELLNFRRKIRGISRQVAQGLDTAARQNAFEELIRDEILPAKDEIEAKLEESNLRFVTKNILLMLAGCAGVVMSGEWLGQLVNTGILAGAVLIESIREERLTIKKNPLGYLYQAQNELGINGE